MKFDKFQDALIDALNKNEDLFNTFKELRELSEKRDALWRGNKLVITCNKLCEKSQRVVFEGNTSLGGEVYEGRIGINHKGIGTMWRYSKKLDALPPRMRSAILEIFKDKNIFGQLNKAIDKRNRKSLQEIKKYFQRKGFENSKQGREDFIININTEDGEKGISVGVDSEGGIDDFVLEWDYGENDLRDLKGLMNQGYKILPEGNNCLKHISKNSISLRLSSVKVLYYLFENKTFIKRELRKKIKSVEKTIKALKGEDDFLSSILNPLIAVDNL